jgi:Sulfotransferase family
MNQPLTILYIAGAGRSGSTILERILGTLPQTITAGELYRIGMTQGIAEKTCSCGAALGVCPFWEEILQRCFPKSDRARTLLEIATLHHTLDHSRHIPKLLLGAIHPTVQQQLKSYRTYLKTLYYAVAAQTQSRILVDSSKVPSRALILAGIPGFEVHVIHLVRDVRALAYAWQKKVAYVPNRDWEIQRYKPHQTLQFWVTCNIFSESLAWKIPYQRIRYETFAQSPQQTLRALLDRIPTLQGASLPFQGQTNQIQLPPFHSIAGNPMRFQSGMTNVTLDESWKQHLNSVTAQTLTVMAAPFLKRYGYPLLYNHDQNCG